MIKGAKRAQQHRHGSRLQQWLQAMYLRVAVWSLTYSFLWPQNGRSFRSNWEHARRISPCKRPLFQKQNGPEIALSLGQIFAPCRKVIPAEKIRASLLHVLCH